MNPSSEPIDRRTELVGNLASVRRRIADACLAAGRSPREVSLIAVTKTFPASDVRLLAELGQRVVAENRDGEAAAKAAELAAAGVDVRWHFVGQLQRNKARSVVRYADVVQSVDRPALVTALAAAVAAHRDRPLDVLIQVSLDDAPGRGGVSPAALPALVDAVLGAAPRLRLRGLMAVAPLGGDPDVAFGRLAERAAWLRERDPDASMLSAGMTGDLEAAIRHGATHVRVGSGLLGRRAKLG
ncbi:YggS family pyridoxal phosphate-dependent enzyme [Actinocatenispora sera]|uniref:Pyridoxal phosphate homeostasis protein n=1 Tax=Actinocatenispora sera TaxID=390989 RepID=A0A810L6Q2_9ACTN|nr:YggS family pyridoxal phosphate-dependent enzyme [Actinocatenispora sera]BCJ30907.1 YggS family pyridoxal phosphate enzyme [Actinocatenispora sera]